MAAFRGISRLFGGGSRSLLLPHRSSSLLIPAQLVQSRGIASKLFVAGLSFFTTEQALSEAFSQFGQVIDAKIVMDRVSDRSKGFGFVTFASEDEAEKAVAEMNGKVLNGRVIYVNAARPKPVFCDAPPIARGSRAIPTGLQVSILEDENTSTGLHFFKFGSPYLKM